MQVTDKVLALLQFLLFCLEFAFLLFIFMLSHIVERLLMPTSINTIYKIKVGSNYLVKLHLAKHYYRSMIERSVNMNH